MLGNFRNFSQVVVCTAVSIVHLPSYTHTQSPYDSVTSPDYELLNRELGGLRSPPPALPTSDEEDTPTYARLNEPYSEHLAAEPYEEHVPAYAEPYEVGHVTGDHEWNPSTV